MSEVTELLIQIVEHTKQDNNAISGVVYVPLDDLGAWKNEIAKELKSCGYNIQSFI